MASNQSAGDFGCCGSWVAGCGTGNGCMYGQLSGTEEEQTERLLHAMRHCTVFKQIYIEKNKEYTESWMASAQRVLARREWEKAHPEEAEKQRQERIRTTRTTRRSDDDAKTNAVLDEAKALLKALGL